MSTESTVTDAQSEVPGEPPAPACVMTFNASDASGAGGIAGDVATIAAMGAHALPVVTAVVMRDTAEVFQHEVLDPDTISEQARSVLEDITIAAWKVGFLGNAESIGAIAEILSDYPDVPLVAYLPNLSWLDDDDQQAYLEALRELVLPPAEVLVGNHQALTDFLLARLGFRTPCVAARTRGRGRRKGTRFVLVSGVLLTGKGGEQFIDNVLASPQGAITGEKFELFETSFVGAGDTLAAALAALLAAGSELHEAVGEALAFLDQSSTPASAPAWAT